MIDIALIRETPELVRAAILKKHGDVSLLDRVIAVDAERKTLRQDTEAKQAEQTARAANQP